MSFRWTNRIIALAALMGGMTLAARGALPGSVTLAWDRSPDPSVAGYYLYCGLTSENYTSLIDVGNSTSYTLTNLVRGATYYFAVSAVDLAGLESDLSGEIRYTVGSPPPAILQLAITPSKQAVLTGGGPVGYRYNIRSTLDFLTWTNLASVTMDTNGLFRFTDPTPATTARRFYVLQQTYP